MQQFSVFSEKLLFLSLVLKQMSVIGGCYFQICTYYFPICHFYINSENFKK